MADALPTCQCVAGQPIPDQMSSIYAALYQLAGDNSLPVPRCVRGLTEKDKTAAIYCATLAWATST